MCWDNSTSDFGLQVSTVPARIWDERRQLPLDSETPLVPLRGRFCLDDSCLKFKESPTHIDIDAAFDSSFQGISIIRPPIPCTEPGTYCSPGTSTNETSIGLITSPQPCYYTNYCAEGSSSPLGDSGGCKKGFYCR